MQVAEQVSKGVTPGQVLRRVGSELSQPEARERSQSKGS